MLLPILIFLVMAVSAAAGGDFDALWSTEDVAKFLGVPPSTVRYWVWQGIAPKSMKIGRYRRFKPADVRKWAESRTELPAVTPRAASRQKTPPTPQTTQRRRTTKSTRTGK
jgi:excisionase family DNA binding protein